MAEPPTPWLMHSQAFYETAMYEKYHPLWLRIAYAAFARCGPNGHAQFEPGELWCLLTGRKYSTPSARTQFSVALGLAVIRGYLKETSSSECLVVAGWFGTTLPGYKKPCPTCTGTGSK